MHISHDVIVFVLGAISGIMFVNVYNAIDDIVHHVRIIKRDRTMMRERLNKAIER